MKKLKFPCAIGIEFTYIKSVFNSKSYNAIRDSLRAITKYGIIEIDQECIEISSPIFFNPSQLLGFYDYIDFYATKILGLRGSITVTEGTRKEKLPNGGLHINMDYSKHFNKNFGYYLNRIFFEYPYINWIFDTPNNHKTDVNYDDNQSIKIHCSYDYYPIQQVLGSIRDSSNRIEFRCFDAVNNKKELVENLKFAIALYKLAESQIGTESIEITSDEFQTKLDKCKSDINFIIEDFKILCQKLNLPFNTYKSRIKTNLIERLTPKNTKTWNY